MRFEDALAQAGLRPREVIADGRIHRCPTDAQPHKRNGWYVLHPVEGRGAFGDWASGGGEPLGTWRDERISTLSQAELARIREAAAARRAEERRHRVQAMRSARAMWQRSRPPSRLHPYLERKGLSPMGTAGLRENDGRLVVPLWLNGWIINVQTIAINGDKLFWPGAPVEGGSCTIAQSNRKPAVTVLCEGLATGLAIYQCVRDARVLVCFNAGNMLKVAQAVRPSGAVVVAADNDWKTAQKAHMHGVNPGIVKGLQVAEALGCGMAAPDGIEGSDFADMLVELGNGGAKKIERAILGQARYVLPEAA